MKKTYTYFMLLLMALVSCSKTDPRVDPTGPEPEPLFVLESDSISEGNMQGMTIGNTAHVVYQAVQKIQEEQQTSKNLQIVANIFTNVQDLKDRLHLYNQLLFDETKGTSKGIQVSFEDDKIKSIWTNNGDKLSHWPVGESVTNRISVGDVISTIYTKLQKLNSIPKYAPRLQRISLFDKNTAKAFDPIMSDSNNWYFSIPLSEKEFHIYYLHFEKGLLIGIKRDLMGNRFK